MQAVARDNGRTILFVSHNMTAVKSLCSRAILLDGGRVSLSGSVNEIVSTYLQRAVANVMERKFDSFESAPGTDQVRIRSLSVIPEEISGTGQLTVKTPFRIECEFWNQAQDMEINLSLHLYGIGGECIFASPSPANHLSKGLQHAVCHIPGDLLNNGIYTVSMMIVKDRSVPLFEFKDGVTFEVLDDRPGAVWFGKRPGAVRPALMWDISANPSLQ